MEEEEGEKERERWRKEERKKERKEGRKEGRLLNYELFSTDWGISNTHVCAMKGITLFNQPFDTTKKMQRAPCPLFQILVSYFLKSPRWALFFLFFSLFFFFPLSYSMYVRYSSAMAVVGGGG